ncbi:MAG TPA: acetate kinase [Candidatus Tectomicrobia bacterium]
MRVLVLNCGSSTLKFQLIDTSVGTADRESWHRLAYGVIEGIGGQSVMNFVADNHTHQDTATLANPGEASQHLFDWLDRVGLPVSGGVDAVGHRVVHGGNRFVEPTRLDDNVIAALEALRDLAPLHNEPALEVIRATRASLGPHLPMVAVFDTAFHHTMPARAAQYALPRHLADKYHIRRYGFHGLAHRYMSERYATLTSTPPGQLKLITLQLGSGCSAAAIQAGHSVDTSMGFTPLEGLIMGTRCGDIDPALPGFLARQEGVDTAEIETWLNTRSGLLGVSEHSKDMRQLLEAEAHGDVQAALAVDMFCYRIRKCIAAYLAVLNGAEAIVFGGGIGENAPAVRERICTNMGWCGLQLDAGRNATARDTIARISADSANLHAYVIPVDEAAIIVQDTVTVLGETKG